MSKPGVTKRKKYSQETTKTAPLDDNNIKQNPNRNECSLGLHKIISNDL